VRSEPRGSALWTAAVAAPVAAFQGVQLGGKTARAFADYIKRTGDALDQVAPIGDPSVPGLGIHWRNEIHRNISALVELWPTLSRQTRKAWFGLELLGVAGQRPGGYTLLDLWRLAGVRSRASVRRVLGNLLRYGVLERFPGKPRYSFSGGNAGTLWKARNEYHRNEIRSALKAANQALSKGKGARGTTRGWEPILGGDLHIVADAAFMPPEWALAAFGAALSIGLEFVDLALDLPDLEFEIDTPSGERQRLTGVHRDERVEFVLSKHLEMLRDSLAVVCHPEKVAEFLDKYSYDSPPPAIEMLLRAARQADRKEWQRWQRRMVTADRRPVLVGDIVPLMEADMLNWDDSKGDI